MLESDISMAPPGIVMRLVSFERGLIVPPAFIVIFICNELMTAKSMSVGEILIQLVRVSEEFERCFVLFLHTIAIANHTPCLRGEQRFLQGLVT